MPLTPATLASGLEALTPTTDVEAAKAAIADAFVDYFVESTVFGISAVKAVLSGVPRTAMIGAMGSLNAPGVGALAIQSGIQAFWAGLLGIEVTIWILVPPIVITPSTTIPPVGNATIAAVIQPIFNANVAAEADLSTAASNVASAIHGTQSGGTITTVTPPAAPVPTPIL